MGIERTLVNVFECFSVTSKISTTAPRWWQILGEHGTYPGSFNVLFIEHAKCFATEVNRSGR